MGSAQIVGLICLVFGTLLGLGAGALLGAYLTPHSKRQDPEPPFDTPFFTNSIDFLPPLGSHETDPFDSPDEGSTNATPLIGWRRDG